MHPLHLPALPSGSPGSEATGKLLLRLWREHIRQHGGKVALIVVTTLLMAGTQALYPVLIDRAINLFEHKDERILYQVPILVVSVTSAKAIAQYFQNVLVQQVVLLVIRDLQARMFAHLTAVDVTRIEREPPATLAARFTTDAVTMREAMTRAVNGLADSLTLIGLVASMLWLDWELCLIAAVLYPIAGLPIQRIGRRIRRASGGMQERMGELAALLHESFAQARTVRAWRLESREIARADTAFQHLYRALLAMGRTRARVDPVLEVLGGGAVAAVIGFAGWRAAVGMGSLGGFTGFVTALLIASRPLRALGTLNAALQEGLAGLTRVFTVIDEAPRITERPDAPTLPSGAGEIVFDHVSFVYPDGRVGLRELSFTARPGLTVALVGPSGGGKSTALSLIPRLYDVSGGAVLIDGADVRDVTLGSLRAAIAYVGQDAPLFDTTVAENIRVGRPDASDEEVAAAARAAAADFVDRLPLGMQTAVGTGGQRLSGGQRQRVALARALLAGARILLLDEATSALDAESEQAVQQALAVLRRGRTTIVVAHRLSTVRDADMVVVIEDGRAVERGSHADLVAADALYARLVRTQRLAA